MSSSSDDASDEAAVCSVFAPDPLERALVLAAEAGRFDVVATLAEELHVRRLDQRQRVRSRR